jgi:hypothetical protein
LARNDKDSIAEHNARMNQAALDEWYRLNPDSGTSMPHVSQMIQSKYVAVGDLAAPQIVTIRGVTLEKIQRDSSERRWIMWFNELPKGLKLNTTLLRYLEQTMGGNSDGWIGKRVRLYVDTNVQFGGRTVGGVRLQAPRGLSQEATGSLYGGAPAPRFDPQTGQPISAPAPAGARFDPMTGKPLSQAAAPPFDPVTGELSPPQHPASDPDFDDDIPF